MHSISRRDFIKGMAAGSLTLATTGILSACTSESTSTSAAETSSSATTTVAPSTSSGIYTPGTYSAQATGIGTITVTMTFNENNITDVVLDLSHETVSIGQAAKEELTQAILSTQSHEIDAISGATVTSQAVSKAADKCIQQAKGLIPIEIITESTETSDGDWLGTEPEIADADIVQTYETEILVVGCGTGGMFAVATAAEEGSKVIGLERFATGVGIRDDLGAIDSRYQIEWGTKIDKVEYMNMAMQYSNGYVNPALVKLFCDESADAINWYGDRLAERGVELWHEAGEEEDPSRYKHYATGHSPRWTGTDDGTGALLDGNKVLHDYAVSKGADFHYNTRMIKLIHDPGKVTGCIATNPDGNYVRYNASKGVIICTGGYSLNYDMLNALQPWNLNVSGMNYSQPGSHGDGIKACLWAGAQMDPTHTMSMFDRVALRPEQSPGMKTCQSEETGLFWMGSQPWLKVNADGDRFFNESGTYEGILHADQFQKGHCHYTLFDSNWGTYAKQFNMHGCARLFPFANGADPNIPYEAIAYEMLPGLIQAGFVAQADTIEELAEKLLLPADELKATVDHYNTLAYNGEDTDFGKESFRLTPVDTAPFYGAKTTSFILNTMDGIQVNTNMNALDCNGNPIEGLFVIGNDAGSYYGNVYPNISTGMCAGRTVTFARYIAKKLSAL